MVGGGKMDAYNPVDDEIDWLTGKHTYKKEKLKRALRRLERETVW